MAFFGGSKKIKQEEINENKKRLEDSIRKELHLVQDGKKLGNKNYMITGLSLPEEKDLIYRDVLFQIHQEERDYMEFLKPHQ